MTMPAMRLPKHVRPRSQAFSGVIPVHFEGHPNGPFEGDGRWVGVKDFEHATLCRAFGLSQTRFYFDLPSSCRGIGSNRGDHRGGPRTIEGFVFMAGTDNPVATLYVCRDADKLRDTDPLSTRDAEAFGYRR